MKKRVRLLITCLLVLCSVGYVSATVNSGMISAATKICEVLVNLQILLYSISAGVGAVIITLQGIKWTGSAEDPGARKEAKMGIIHAVIGLIIVSLATAIVAMIFTQGKCIGWAE